MTEHDHDGEPNMWCETHQHEHIATVPRFTYLCKDCGWGQWHRTAAREHEAWTQEHERWAHEAYEVEHVMVPLPTDEPTEAEVKAAAQRMAVLDLPDNHTLDDRLTVKWQRYMWKTCEVLEAARTARGEQHDLQR